MHFLVLAVLSSSAMALILKYSEIQGHNRYAVTSLNYLMAAGVSLSALLMSPPGVELPGIPGQTFLHECSMIIAGEAQVFSLQASRVWAVIIGSSGGIFYCAGFIAIQKCIAKNGVSLTGAVSKLGILLPVSCALIVWKEIPTALQTTGIALALVSIGVLNMPGKSVSDHTQGSRMMLMVLFVVMGMGDFMGKLFEKYALPETGTLFLVVLFSTALCVSLWFFVRDLNNGGRLTSRDILTGLVVGVPNLLTSWCLINAFRHVKTTLVFPLFSSGAIVVITLGGILVFKERLRNRESMAIAMIIGGVVLMGS